MSHILSIALISFVQNASFTLVSRARNSDSLMYHGIASVFSNALWLLVMKNLVTNIESPETAIGYMIGTISGSLTMHWIVMNVVEKKK